MRRRGLIAACAAPFVLAAVAAWGTARGSDCEADDTRALVAWLKAPALSVPDDITLPLAEDAPMHGTLPWLIADPDCDPSDFLEVRELCEKPIVDVPSSVSLVASSGRRTEVALRTLPLAPVVILSPRGIRFAIAEFSRDLPAACDDRCLDDALRRLRLVLEWSRDEARRLPLVSDGRPGAMALVLMADWAVPFRMLQRVMDVLGEAGARKAVLAAKTPAGLGGFVAWAQHDNERGEWGLDVVVS